jgi:hypothetical protein
MSRWLQSLTKPLGLMACNDDRARQVVEACKLAGVSLPGQIGIVGVDNDDVVCGLSDPPLSSVAVNFEQAGYEAAGGQNCAAPGRDPDAVVRNRRATTYSLGFRGQGCRARVHGSAGVGTMPLRPSALDIVGMKGESRLS